MKLFSRFKRKNAELSGFQPPVIFKNKTVQNVIYDRRQAIDKYLAIAPIADPINLIAIKAANINPILKNTKNGDIIADHPLLDLLQNPNTNNIYADFIKTNIAYYLITGNNFLIATGDVNKPPLELFVQPPQSISIVVDTSDGYAGEYHVSGSHTYSRLGFSDSDFLSFRGNLFRFFNSTKTQELYQIKDFNPLLSYPSQKGPGEALFGLSPLTPHSYDIEQYELASIHNISLLRRGATPSIVITTDGSTLSDEQYQRLMNQIRQQHEGASNAGRPMMMSGPQMKVTALSQSNKDMDFLELKKELKMSIYDTFKVPKPYYLADAMTLANMESANLMLHDDAILPVLDVIFKHIGNFLLKRYPDGQDLELTYDENTIEALEPRRMAKLKELNALQVTTINEVRKKLNIDPANNADDIYRPLSDIVVANTTGQEIPPRPNSGSSEPKSPETVTDVLGQITDNNGKKLFSDQEIVNLIKACNV